MDEYIAKPIRTAAVREALERFLAPNLETMSLAVAMETPEVGGVVVTLSRCGADSTADAAGTPGDCSQPQQVTQVQTDAEGRVQFSNLTPGIYEVAPPSTVMPTPERRVVSLAVGGTVTLNFKIG